MGSQTHASVSKQYNMAVVKLAMIVGLGLWSCTGMRLVNKPHHGSTWKLETYLLTLLSPQEMV